MTGFSEFADSPVARIILLGMFVLALALLTDGCIWPLGLVAGPAMMALTQTPTPSGSKPSNDLVLSSDASDYLHDHQLPNVNAQVLRGQAGTVSAVVLTGEVATEFGKQDAARKVRDLLNDPTVEVRNQIEIAAPRVFTPDQAYWDNIAAARTGCKAGDRAECTRYQVIMDSCLQESRACRYLLQQARM